MLYPTKKTKPTSLLKLSTLILLLLLLGTTHILSLPVTFYGNIYNQTNSTNYKNINLTICTTLENQTNCNTQITSKNYNINIAGNFNKKVKFFINSTNTLNYTQPKQASITQINLKINSNTNIQNHSSNLNSKRQKNKINYKKLNLLEKNIFSINQGDTIIFELNNKNFTIKLLEIKNLTAKVKLNENNKKLNTLDCIKIPTNSSNSTYLLINKITKNNLKFSFITTTKSPLTKSSPQKTKQNSSLNYNNFKPTNQNKITSLINNLQNIKPQKITNNNFKLLNKLQGNFFFKIPSLWATIFATLTIITLLHIFYK